ncbi:MAG: RluA family pseudouridine synthase [Hydrogenophilus sp.]|nr:RluA family pseudouridine synthase [Hydrogenophilus sp.]
MTVPSVNEKGGVRYLTVDEGPQRLDNFLARSLKGVPRRWIWRAIRSGEVRIDGRRADPATRVTAGQRVRVPPVRLGEGAQRGRNVCIGPAPSVEVLYEDEALAVLSKPAGLAAHGGSGVRWGLIEWLRASRPQGGNWALVHRLDRDTSGLMVVAKRRRALTALQADWRTGRVRKHYLALVLGQVRQGDFVIDAPLLRGVTAGGERRVRVAAEGKAAMTRVRRLAVWEEPSPGFSWLEVSLETGRTHQIRAHLAYVHHPLVGDEKYGDFALNRVFAKRWPGMRLALHAYRLAFFHPLSGEEMSFTAPLPADLTRLLTALGPPSLGEVYPAAEGGPR